LKHGFYVGFEVAEILKKKEIELVLVHLPYRDEAEGDSVRESPWLDKFFTHMDKNNLKIHRLNVPNPVDDIYEDNAHLSLEGHQWLADRIQHLLPKR
ncbi:MAG: hypothetical protein AAF492_31495, partial [Verrucomicrobiota bacterium]